MKLSALATTLMGAAAMVCVTTAQEASLWLSSWSVRVDDFDASPLMSRFHETSEFRVRV